MAVVIFRDTATNYFHKQRRLLALFHVFYTTTHSPPEAFERMSILKLKEKLYLAGMVLTLNNQ